MERQSNLQSTILTLVTVLLKRNEWLHQLVMRWKSRRNPGLIVRPGKTRLVIEAYPRSANSFIIKMLRIGNPQFQIDNTTICHHTHSIHSVKKAVRHGIPALVVIRDPVDCVTSSCIARDSSDPRIVWAAATEYLDFYGWLVGRLEEVVLVTFEEAIGGDLNLVTKALNRRFNLGLNEDIDTARVKEQVEDRLIEYSPNRDNPLRYPMPTPERKELASEIRASIQTHPRVVEASRLYDTLLEEQRSEERHHA